MKKIFIALLMTSCAFPVFAQENTTVQENTSTDKKVEQTVQNANKKITPTPIKPDKEIIQQMLEDSEWENDPMTPEQIRKMRLKLDEREKAMKDNIYGQVVAQTRNVELRLNAGEAIPTIRVVKGSSTALTFYDSTGQPWPLMSTQNGNEKAFKANILGNAGETNMLTIANGEEAYMDSNIILALKDNPIPLVFNLKYVEAGAFDGRVDIKILKPGPNAKIDIGRISTLPATDEDMLGFLSGVPPEGAKKVYVNSKEIKAWMYNEKMYIVSHHKLVNPAPLGSSKHISGEYVFFLQPTPVMMFSMNGELVSIYTDRNKN